VRATMGILVLLASFALAVVAGCGGDAPGVVLYCGVDQDQSQAIAKAFEAESGVSVAYYGETEAMRSIGLPQKLLFEKERPRADVYWSNEIMHMVKLVRAGVMDPLPAGLAEEFPAEWRDPKKTYIPFGGRARVFLVNTELLPDEADWPKTLSDLLDPKYAERRLATCMAEPLTGTTYTHAVAMLMRDTEAAKAFFEAVAQAREKGSMKVVGSNGRVMRAVKDSANKVAFGLTDTDDAWIAVQEGKPVTIVYPDQAEGEPGTVLIPNTAALVRGRPHPKNAEKLLRWLVSSENEERLAASRSAQMPLRAGVPVPADGHVKRPGVDFRVAEVDWNAVGENADRWRDLLTRLFKSAQ
jgi:iron(III) transport system substrate-binding protein